MIGAGAIYDSSKPTISLCVNKNSPYNTAKDLEGQTIAVPNLKSTGGIAISEWLVRSNVDLTKIKFFEMLFSEMGPALAAGRDRGGTQRRAVPDRREERHPPHRQPLRLRGEELLHRRLVRTQRAGSTPTPRPARRIVKALYTTANWANTHQSDSAVIAAKLTKLDVQKVRSFVRNTFATSLDAKYAQPLLDLALKYKLIEKPTQAHDFFWSPPA